MTTPRIYITSALVLAAAFGGCDRREGRPQGERPGAPAAPRAEQPPPPAEPRAERPAAPSEPRTEPQGARGGPAEPAEPQTQPAGYEKRKAEGEFKGAKGSKLRGDVELKEVSEGVQVQIEVRNAPVGTKAVYVHERGDCSDIEGASMGEQVAVGERQEQAVGKRSLGDLGSIEIGKDGKGKLEAMAPGATLKADAPQSLLSKAIVIYVVEDASRAGDKAKPIACAVIKKG